MSFIKVLDIKSDIINKMNIIEEWALNNSYLSILQYLLSFNNYYQIMTLIEPKAFGENKGTQQAFEFLKRINTLSTNALNIAIKDGNLKIIKYMKDVDWIGPKSNIMIYAAGNGQLGLVKLLLELYTLRTLNCIKYAKENDQLEVINLLKILESQK